MKEIPDFQTYNDYSKEELFEIIVQQNRIIQAANNGQWIKLAHCPALYSVSLNTIRKWVEESGARRRIGRTVMVDRKALDEYIDAHDGYHIQ